MGAAAPGREFGRDVGEPRVSALGGGCGGQSLLVRGCPRRVGSSQRRLFLLLWLTAIIDRGRRGRFGGGARGRSVVDRVGERSWPCCCIPRNFVFWISVGHPAYVQALSMLHLDVVAPQLADSTLSKQVCRVIARCDAVAPVGPTENRENLTKSEMY
jgi:hypothetical protein